MTNYVRKEVTDNGSIVLEDLKWKTRIRHGQVHESTAVIVDGVFKFNAIISKDKQTIMLFGKDKQQSTKEYQTTFNVGDLAEYDSYNFQYLGTITKITEKCVTIVAYKGSRNETVHRLDLALFAHKNYDFDLEEIQKRNADVSMSI